jgi:uncharacterized protein
MLLTREQTDANLIRAWEPGRVRVGEHWYPGHLLVSAEKLIDDWSPTEPLAVVLADLEPALALEPEIIVLGIGVGPVLPDIELMAAMAERAVGLEIMDLPAACRTYNVLVHEGRRVVAALLNTAPSAPAAR